MQISNAHKMRTIVTHNHTLFESNFVLVSVAFLALFITLPNQLFWQYLFRFRLIIHRVISHPIL